jgi:hypothetical protein
MDDVLNMSEIDEGFLDDAEESLDDELEAAGMHVEGEADEDDDEVITPEME